VPCMVSGEAGNLYHRVSYRYAPHNLYLYLSQYASTLDAMGYTQDVQVPPTLEFADSAQGAGNNATAVAASAITVPFSDGFVARWSWDAGAGKWLRSMDGETLDAGTNAQVGASNVVILWVPHNLDAAGGTTYEIDLGSGSGAATVFTNGKRIDGTWVCDGSTPPRFLDASGQSILLAPGNTWFQVLIPNMAIQSS